jgi:hypothetical protein
MTLPAAATAGPIELSIATPDFLVPVAGQNGTLTVYSDGTVERSGFNVLGTQTFTLGGNSTSTGTLTLNLVFSGPPLGAPFGDIAEAILNLTVFDFDLVTDYVTQKVTLKEMAVLTKVNGEWLPSSERINLGDYVPSGARLDDRYVRLNPISLFPGPLSSTDFIDPLMLSFKLTATAKNTGSQAVVLRNTPEALVSDVSVCMRVLYC